MGREAMRVRIRKHSPATCQYRLPSRLAIATADRGVYDPACHSSCYDGGESETGKGLHGD